MRCTCHHVVLIVLLVMIFFIVVNVDAVLSLEENRGQEQRRQIFSLLHRYSAFLASLPGVLLTASLLLFQSGIFLLCLHESKAVFGLLFLLLSPVCSQCALHIFLVEPSKHCILRRTSYVNTVTFIIG